jgi:acyl-coenzyme A thioesterase PaaI-like protein
VTSEALDDAVVGDDVSSDDRVVRFDPWIEDIHYRGGGSEYRDLLAEFRRLADALAACTPPPQDMKRVERGLAEMRAILEPHAAPFGQGYSGNRHDLPGRGHAHLIPARVTRWTTNQLEAIVVFGAAHIGGNGAVHGGMQPLLFDEVMGRLSNGNRRVRCRTAYLKTSYLKVTLPEVEYNLNATVDREQGRKRYLSGRLTDPEGEHVAIAEGLFIALRDGAR